MNMNALNLRHMIFLSVLAVAFLLPGSVYGQESSANLRATIRAELLSDPRTSGMSQAQIDSLVGLLLDEAKKQGITSQDIQWQPKATERSFVVESAMPVAPECMEGFFCTMTEAFGFIGADTTIPFALGATSMGLIWILAEMMHRRRHPAIKVAPPTAMPSL